jgi:hypothetical protein
MTGRFERCDRCVFAVWPKGAPVDMDADVRTIGNGGLGECRRHPPAVHNDVPRAFPYIWPDDWCGEFRELGPPECQFVQFFSQDE